MGKRLALSIVTPEKVAWEGEVDSLVVPAFEGLLGVLPGHAPLLTQLTEGVVRMRSGAEEKLLSVSGGFLEVLGERASVFAETAEMADEIDAERAHQAAEKARQALQGRSDEPFDAEKANAALRRALVRLKVARTPGRRPSRPPT
jgi:F-type H+-transporting ATPase subunit epsilon